MRWRIHKPENGLGIEARIDDWPKTDPNLVEAAQGIVATTEDEAALKKQAIMRAVGDTGTLVLRASGANHIQVQATANVEPPQKYIG